MVNHYEAASGREHYFSLFELRPPVPQPASLVFQGQQGTFVRRPRTDHPGSNGGVSRFEAVSGRWGLIPLFSGDGQDPLFNANAETASGERNFYQPWKRGHRCVILADAVYREGPQDGVLVRVARADGKPLAIAGLWNGWRSPEGACVESFAMFSIPADDAALPGRRYAAILPDAWVDDWLYCPVEETAAYLRPYTAGALVFSHALPPSRAA
jgi:putative SOS response-associated peptidase YedK